MINFIRQNKTITILIIIGAILFFFALLYIITLFWNNGILNPFSDKTKMCLNEEGDMIGGLINPILGFSVCIFSGLAFYAQYQANKQIQDQFKIQSENEYFFKVIDIKNSIIQNSTIKIDEKQYKSYDAINLLIDQFNKNLEESFSSGSLFFQNIELISLEDLEPLFNCNEISNKLKTKMSEKKYEFERVLVFNEFKRDIKKRLDRFFLKISKEYYYKLPFERRAQLNKSVIIKMKESFPLFDIYFRNIEHIINFIANTNNKNYYNFFKDHLSIYEKTLIFLNLYGVENQIILTSIIDNSIVWETYYYSNLFYNEPTNAYPYQEFKNFENVKRENYSSSLYH